MSEFALGISGASGMILARRALQQLVRAGHFVHVIPSRHALVVAALELGKPAFRPSDFAAGLSAAEKERVAIYSNGDFSAPIASGSYRIAGTMILPCSMTTLGAIASGVSDNLLRRCADVALKERFPLVIAPREAPISAIHLKNMLQLAQAGAHIFPPLPLWYSQPTSLDEMEEAIAGRALQLLGVETTSEHFKPWGAQSIPLEPRGEPPLTFGDQRSAPSRREKSAPEP